MENNKVELKTNKNTSKELFEGMEQYESQKLSPLCIGPNDTVGLR